MLIPYPLEPPPPIPPLDDPWETPPFYCRIGRRAWVGEDGAKFSDGVTLERLEVLGPLELRDRRMAALEEPLIVWEVEAEGPVQLTAEVEFTSGRVHYERAEDGSRLWLSGEEPVEELLVSCYGGTVEASAEEEGIRLHARGTGRVRLVIVGAWSEEDRDRTLRALLRKGVAGVVAQRLRHAEMLARLGVKVTTRDPEVGADFEEDKRWLDSMLLEDRRGHRFVADPEGEGVALLTFGLREPVRDTLRAPLDDAARRRLFASYAMWVGVDDFVRRHWPRLMQEVRAAEAGYRSFRLDEDRGTHVIGAGELLPLAEALGDLEAIEVLEGVAVGVDREAAQEEVIEGWQETALDHWHLVPNALDGTLTLAPELPPDWPEMTVERIRCGDTTLDARVRRTRSGVAVHVRVTHGPRLVVHLAPVLPFLPTGILVGEDQVPGPTVRVVVSDEVVATWMA